MDIDKYKLEPPHNRFTKQTGQKNRFNGFSVMSLVFVALVIGAAFYAGSYVIAKPSFCGSCHQISEYVDSWRESPHKKVTCQQCHDGPGALRKLDQRIQAIKNFGLTVSYFQRNRPMLATTVNVTTCLECHRDINEKTVTTNKSVRVSHKEFSDIGWGCGQCHPDVGHKSNSAGAKRSMHEYCFVCHQANQQNGTCSYCHTSDFGQSNQSPLENYPIVNLEGINSCNECHSTAGCRRCHSSTIEPLVKY